MDLERSKKYRERALEIEQMAERVRSPEMKRAYLILARDWHRMADEHSDIKRSASPLEQLVDIIQAEQKAQ
jgi:hypothetical protein